VCIKKVYGTKLTSVLDRRLLPLWRLLCAVRSSRKPIGASSSGVGGAGGVCGDATIDGDRVGAESLGESINCVSTPESAANVSQLTGSPTMCDGASARKNTPISKFDNFCNNNFKLKHLFMVHRAFFTQICKECVLFCNYWNAAL
jgi:hypothetical protein